MEHVFTKTAEGRCRVCGEDDWDNVRTIEYSTMGPNREIDVVDCRVCGAPHAEED